MSNQALKLFHRLPSQAQTVAATLRGLQLRSWRYGPGTERLVAEALDREQWNSERWRQWQQEQLSYMLEKASAQVPFYREQWSKRRRNGDKASPAELANWPVLEKEELRKHPRAFLVDKADVRRMFHDHTSGTSGKPLDLWFSLRSTRSWYALFEARCRRWYGLSRHDRWAMLGGQLVTAVNVRRPPFWVWNAALNQLYMSTYHLAPDLIRFYLEAIEQYRIKYLLGYPSAIHQLAEGALALGKKVNLEIVVVNAEPLLTHQREAIIEAFQCPVRETYGLAETVAAASECENGVLHLWPEAGFVEVLDGQAPAEKGVSADLIATGFINTDMPLIRYRTGDRIALGSDDGPCNCGRTLPKLALVEGRCDDLLFTKDGRRVGRLDPVFKGRLPIREAQIVQETLAEIRVLCVPTSNFNNQAREQIIASIRGRMGDINVVVEEVDELPRTANGKLRAVICKVPAEETARK